MPWGWIFAQIIGNGRSTTVVKMMAVHWRLTFLRRGQVCFPMHLYGPHVENFRRILLWSLWANIAESSFVASMGQGNESLLKWLRSIDQDGRHARIWSKHLKFFFQNRGCLGAESLHKSSGMVKWWSYIDVWPFYDKVKFASLCICMGPIHLYGKNVENFKRLLHWSLLANVAQILCGAFLGQENDTLLKWWRFIDQDGRHAHIWLKPLKSSSPEPGALPKLLPASVAQLDAPSDWRPEGRGFNLLRGRQHSFVEIDHEIFSTVVLSFPLIQEG